MYGDLLSRLVEGSMKDSLSQCPEPRAADAAVMMNRGIGAGSSSSSSSAERPRAVAQPNMDEGAAAAAAATALAVPRSP